MSPDISRDISENSNPEGMPSSISRRPAEPSHHQDIDYELPVTPPKEGLQAPLDIPLRDRGWNFSESFHRGPSRRSPRVTTVWSFAAAMIDVLVVSGLSLMISGFTIIMFKEELKGFSGFIFNQKLDVVMVVMIGFSFIYMLMLRSHLGFSLGDLACGLRLGTLEQRKARAYPWLVLLRVSVLFVTGIATIPLLSFMLGKDLAGKISGVSIVSTK